MDLRFGKQDQKITTVENGGMFSRQMCTRIARKVMDMYDDNKDGIIETITAGKMLMDLYRAMNKDFHPTATDIASYARIYDRNNKGKITYEDLEALSLKYFWNQQVSFFPIALELSLTPMSFEQYIMNQQLNDQLLSQIAAMAIKTCHQLRTQRHSNFEFGGNESRDFLDNCIGSYINIWGTHAEAFVHGKK